MNILLQSYEFCTQNHEFCTQIDGCGEQVIFGGGQIGGRTNVVDIVEHPSQYDFRGILLICLL